MNVKDVTQEQYDKLVSDALMKIDIDGAMRVFEEFTKYEDKRFASLCSIAAIKLKSTLVIVG